MSALFAVSVSLAVLFVIGVVVVLVPLVAAHGIKGWRWVR